MTQLTPDEYLSIEKCDCGRTYCKFFSGLIGERGESFTTNDIHNAIDDVKKFTQKSDEIIEHLKSLLN